MQMNKFITINLLLILSLLVSCTNFDSNKLFNFNKAIYYEDIHLLTFEGINPVKKNESRGYIEIVSKDENKVVLKIHEKIGEAQEYYSYKEIFLKKDDYYYQYKEDNDDNPYTLIKKYTYLKNDFILIIDNTTHKKIPEYSRITKITPNKNLIEEIEIEGELVEPNPNLDFNNYKSNPKIFTITENQLEVKNNELIVKGKITNFKYKQNSKNYTSYYKGYPNTSRVNSYWNLYKYYFGRDLRHE
jgi:hypothetical protein